MLDRDPKRKWFRFHLRTGILGVLIAGAFAWAYWSFKSHLEEPAFSAPGWSDGGRQPSEVVRESTNSKKKWVGVGCVDGLDAITHAHVTALLQGKGIDSVLEGSLVYGVSVPENDLVDAIRVLKEDAKKGHYAILIHDGNELFEYGPPKDQEWLVDKIDEKYATVIRQEKYGESTELGRVLRESLVRSSVPPFAFVVCVKSLKREYLDSSGKMKTGYDVEIELSADLHNAVGGKRISFQVWDGGKKINFIGGNEWWQGDEETVKRNKKIYGWQPSKNTVWSFYPEPNDDLTGESKR
jgi:hypothetical protein